jgi:hypothetical protein
VTADWPRSTLGASHLTPGALRAALPPLLAALVLAVAAWTPLAARLPALGVFRGPLGALLVAAGLGAALLRLRPGGRSLVDALGTLPAPALFAAAFALYAGLGLHYIRGIQASGDEVEYLLLAQSLWREHDLDLEDNFTRGDHLEYTPGLDAMPFGTFRADGRPISTHSPGLPLLLAPFYALGGRAGCVLLLALLGALLALESFRLALRLTGERAAAALAWLATAGPPALYYSFHLYTEVPTALASVAALRLLLAGPGVGGAALAALLAVLLPWLHVKLIPAAAVLGLVALWRLRGRPLAAFCAVAGLGAAAYLGFYWHVYGDPSPLALYGSKVPKKVKRASPLDALVGLLFDGAFGLLPNAPVFLVGLAGLPLARRVAGRDGAALLMLAAAIFAPLLAWQTWWAGHCPPARFLVPLAPALGALAALRTRAAATGLVRWRGPLAAFGLALSVYMSAQPGREHFLLTGRGAPPAVWEQLGGQPALSRYLPLLTSGSPTDRRVALVWALLAAALLALDALARTRPRVDRLFTPWFAVALWLLLGLLVDGWARAG